MTESLKSIRFLHNLLVLVCAAIIVFAYTPDRARRYSAAEHELANYLQLSPSDYPEYLYTLPSINKEEQKEKSQVIAMLRQNGYHVSDDVAFVVPIWANPINVGGSLATFCRLAERKQIVVLPHVIPESIRPVNTASEAAFRSDPGDVVTAVSFGPPPNDNLESNVQPLGAQPTDFPTTSLLTLSIKRRNGQQVQTTLQMAYVSGESETGYFGTDWLKSTSHGSGLVEHNQCLPNSWQAFPEISRMQPADAMRYLESKSEAEKKNDLEVSSLRIDSATVGWAAPIILILLLVFFISQVRHLRFVLKKSAGALDYPWVGIFPDLLGRLIAYATIVVMPVLSEILLATRVVTVSLTLRICAPILVTLLSIWAGRELWKLRSTTKVHSAIID